MEDGDYHLYIVTQDGSQARLYYDGTLIGTAGYRDASYTNNIVLGGTDGYADYQWNGKIGLWAVYNRALTASEVTDIWNTSKSQFGR